MCRQKVLVTRVVTIAHKDDIIWIIEKPPEEYIYMLAWSVTIKAIPPSGNIFHSFKIIQKSYIHSFY